MSLHESPAALRRRLMNPPNAVPDFGIDLRVPSPEKADRQRRQREEEERQRRFDDACLDFFNWQATVVPEHVRRVKGIDPSFNRIVIETAKHFGVSTRDIRAVRRFPPFVRARQVAYWLARKTTMLTYPQIGRLIARDHTTILFGVRKIEALRVHDAKLQRSLDVLLSVLRPLNSEIDNAEDIPRTGC